MTTVVQTNAYDLHPTELSAGEIARGFPFRLKEGVAYVSSSRKPRPGDAVVYNAANDGFACPTATTLKDVVGVVVHTGSVVPKGTTTPVVEYENGEALTILYEGVVGCRFAVASNGSAETYHFGDRVEYQVPSAIGDQTDWAAVAATALSEAPAAFGGDLTAIPATLQLTTARTALDTMRTEIEAVRTALATISSTINHSIRTPFVMLNDATVAVGAEKVLPVRVNIGQR